MEALPWRFHQSRWTQSLTNTSQDGIRLCPDRGDHGALDAGAGTAPTIKPSKTLMPLDEVRSDILVLSNFVHDKARPHRDGGGDHERDPADIPLTGGRPQVADRTSSSGSRWTSTPPAGRQRDRLPSPELGTEPEGREKCDSYSLAYSSHISWKSATVPTAKRSGPCAVFERMFGGAKHNPAVQARRAYTGRAFSISSPKEPVGSSRDCAPAIAGSWISISPASARWNSGSSRSRNLRPACPRNAGPQGIPPTWAEHIRLYV